MKIVIQGGGGSFPIVSSSVFFQSWCFLEFSCQSKKQNWLPLWSGASIQERNSQKTHLFKIFIYLTFSTRTFLHLFFTHFFFTLPSLLSPPLSLTSFQLPICQFEKSAFVPSYSTFQLHVLFVCLFVLLFNSMFYLELHSTYKDRKDQAIETVSPASVRAGLHLFMRLLGKWDSAARSSKTNTL